MVCDDCDAVGPSDPRAADPICDDDAAVAAWNRRADPVRGVPPLLAARAALAAAPPDGPAVPEGREPAAVAGEPSDGDPPLGPFSEHDLRQQWNQQADEFNQWDSLDSCEQLAWAQARAIAADRARWGRPAPAPVEGEVAELVNWLRETGDLIQPSHLAVHQRYKRTADLLEQRQAAPVPVSERLPGDQLCWWFETDEDCGYGSNWTLLRIKGSATGYTHWLPAHALPLPNGEVEA